jgi:hypothetical protein
MGRDKNDLELQICREIAKEINAPLEEVITIVRAQSKYVTHVMEHSGFEAVSLPYLGKFLVKPMRLKKLNEAMAEKRLLQTAKTWESSEKKTTR